MVCMELSACVAGLALQRLFKTDGRWRRQRPAVDGSNLAGLGPQAVRFQGCGGLGLGIFCKDAAKSLPAVRGNRAHGQG